VDTLGADRALVVPGLAETLDTGMPDTLLGKVHKEEVGTVVVAEDTDSVS
jgi:hypothetical protein